MAKAKKFTGYNYRYCPRCKSITNFEYDKMISHCFCKKCTCSIGALRVTKNNRQKIINMLNHHCDESINKAHEFREEQIKLLEKLLKQVKEK